jgi:hypothetical protein
MAEALACGTPVVARRRGSVPELVDHRRTGLIGETDEELAELCRRAGSLDRAACRSEAERRFSVRAMADAYEGVYRRVLRTSGVPAGLPPAAAEHDDHAARARLGNLRLAAQIRARRAVLEGRA